MFLHFTPFLSLPSNSLPFSLPIFPSKAFHLILFYSIPFLSFSLHPLPFPSLPLHLKLFPSIIPSGALPCPALPFHSIFFCLLLFHFLPVHFIFSLSIQSRCLPFRPNASCSSPFLFHLAPLTSSSLLSLIPSIISSQLRSVALSISSQTLLPCTLTAKLWLGPVLLHRSLLTIIHLGRNVI